jgi:hypothetical protein
MTRCPHCHQRTITWSQKLYLKGSAACPACRGKFRFSTAGGVLMGSAVAAYFLTIALAQEPALFFSALAIPVLAVLLYTLAVPVAPWGKTGPHLFPCPHCGKPAITWKQKYAVRPFRTAECPACRGNFSISPVIWAFYAPLLAILLIQDRLPHPFLAPALILAGVLLATIIKVLWIPLVKK